jgi:replicative DNA helicase
VVIDYLQILNIREERGQTRAAAIGAVTRQLKALGGKLDAAVMIGSQLNREGATRDDGPAPVPQLAMLKESGSIEQDSSMVLMLHDPKDKERNMIRDLYVRKNRMGEVGKAELRFKPEHSRFYGVETVSW